MTQRDSAMRTSNAPLKCNDEFQRIFRMTRIDSSGTLDPISIAVLYRARLS
jgi:hypothetical protein